MEAVVVILFGLAIGSFVNALVWRLHQQARTKSKTAKQKLSVVHGRSMCPDCRHQLSWFDLIPVLSWLMLRGRCRYCKKPISWSYPATELLVAVLAGVSYSHWPFSLSNFTGSFLLGVWLVILALLAALVLYDLRWMTLPNQLIYPLAAAVVVFKVVEYLDSKQLSVLGAAVMGAVLLGGFFWLLYQISASKWIGGGDVRYGFIMGSLLGWQQALLGLALASYIGVAVILVLVVLKKYKRHLKMPFGPLLITATYICIFWGQPIIEAYKRISGL